MIKISKQTSAVLFSILLGCGSSSAVSTDSLSEGEPENNDENLIGDSSQEQNIHDLFNTENARSSVYAIINEQFFDISRDYPIKLQSNVVAISETDGFVYLLTTYKMDIVDIVRAYLAPNAVPIGDARLTVNNVNAELVFSNEEVGYSLFRVSSGQGVDFHGLVNGDSESLQGRDKLITLGYIAVLGPFLEEGYFVERMYLSSDRSRELERRNRFAYRSTDFFVGAPLFTEDADGNLYLIGLAEDQDISTLNNFNIGVRINSIIEDINNQGLHLNLTHSSQMIFNDF